MTDVIPVISQLKSAVQLFCGDPEAAKETQKNFVQKCPVVSHVVGGVTLLIAARSGDDKAVKFAEDALIAGTLTLVDVVTGNIVGLCLVCGIHQIRGDHECRNKALISVGRTIVIMVTGTLGFVLLGPVGAVAGGIISGIAFDGIHTLADKDGPHGIWALGQQHKVGDIFDTVVGIGSDGLTGYTAGKFIDKAFCAPEINALENIQDNLAELNLNEPVANLEEVLSQVTVLETGKKYYEMIKNIGTKAKLTSPGDPKPKLFARFVKKLPKNEELPINRVTQSCADTHAFDQLLRQSTIQLLAIYL